MLLLIKRGVLEMFQSKLNSLALSSAALLSAISFGCSSSATLDLEDIQTVTAQEDLGVARLSAITELTDITLTSGSATVGSVQQYYLAARDSFALYDAEGEIKAIAVKRAFFSLGECIDITDGDGNVLGYVSEDLWKESTNFLAPHKRYFKITDKDNKVIAESEKFEILGTTITLTSPTGETLAVLNRSAFDAGKATWTIDKKGEIDWRLLIFIPSFKTSAENAEE
jgi:uncharacterized protein YxjI